MEKIAKYKTCEFKEDCGDTCIGCSTCRAKKGSYNPECEDCNYCREGALATMYDLNLSHKVFRKVRGKSNDSD